MSDLIIRPARAEEQPLIRSMIRAERLDPTHLHWPNFLVAETAGRIVGMGQVKPYRGARELGSLAVVADMRRSGVGAALIHALLARETGPLYLFCLEFREPYYNKFGFRRVGYTAVPDALKLKYAAGSVFTRLVRQRLIIMWRPADQVSDVAA